MRYLFIVFRIDNDFCRLIIKLTSHYNHNVSVIDSTLGRLKND